MSRLDLIPHSWWSWNFDVVREESAIAQIGISCWRENGTVDVAGTAYQVRRTSLLKGTYILESTDNVRIAQAVRPSLGRRSFAIQYGMPSGSCTLQAASFCTRRLVLRDDSHEMGTITPAGSFTRQAQAELPDQMPLAVQVFVLWLAVLLWKRESDAAAATVAVVAAST